MADRGAVVVGASSGVGRAIAGELAAAGYRLALGARSARDLEAVAAHLSFVHGVTARAKPLDLELGSEAVREWAAWSDDAVGPIQLVVIAAGAVHDDDSAAGDAELLERLHRTNFLGPAALLLDLVPRMDLGKGAAVVVLSSIAAGAPRRRNAGYAGAKRALEALSLSLRHQYAPRLLVHVYRLGYVDTAMSFGRELAFPPVDPTRVARHIVRRLGSNTGIRYYPRYWRAVVIGLNLLPWAIYRRLDF